MANDRVEIRATPDWLKAVDDWRNAQPVPPKRGAAIKALVEIALKHLKGKSK